MTVDGLCKVLTVFRINQALFSENLKKCHFRQFVIPAEAEIQEGAGGMLDECQRFPVLA